MVDADALGVMCGICSGKKIALLSDLLNKLARRNNRSTVDWFVAANFVHDGCITPFGCMVEELMEEDWNVMEPLAMGVLGILGCDVNRCETYGSVLRHLPIERQYGMITAGIVPLSVIGDVYPVEKADLLLRGIFALARCSHNPSQEIRRHIANKDHDLGQFLPDCSTMKIARQLPRSIPTLSADEWRRIFRLLDIETLAFVLPLVCTFWRRLYVEALARDTRMHDLYLQDLSRMGLSRMHTIMPWKYCLSNEAAALRYMGQCIAKDALSRAPSAHNLLCEARRYLAAVTDGQALLPRVDSCSSPYESFLKLFGMIYVFCADRRPILERPGFLTSEEYGLAVRYFVCERKWILKLSDSLIVDNMPLLFRIVEEREELMTQLVSLNCSTFEQASIILIMHGQTNDVPERLAKLIFSRTILFKRFAEPYPIPPREYYRFIAESGTLCSLVANFHRIGRLDQLVISLILFFKGNADEVGRIVASVNSQLPNHTGYASRAIRSELKSNCFRILDSSNAYPAEDIKFAKRIMMKLED